jgi:hypothetical protein
MEHRGRKLAGGSSQQAEKKDQTSEVRIISKKLKTSLTVCDR